MNLARHEVVPTKMVNEFSPKSIIVDPLAVAITRALIASLVFVAGAIALQAQQAPAPAPDDGTTLVVEGISESDVFGMGRSVEVRGTVRQGVISLGGDVIVVGRVEGDVASIGGSVIQRAGSYVGGDIIVVGGAYQHVDASPGRKPESMTVMYAGYEAELRRLMRDPTTILTPHFSATYVGQRILAVLFWFIVSLALTAVTPNSVSRAAARLQLTNLRVGVIGLLAAIITTFGMLVCLYLLPSAVSGLLGIMVLVLVILSYVFGRVVIHAATGRWLQRHVLSEGKRSESAALLIGAGFWTLALSLPFIWPAVVAVLLVTSLGLALTARYRGGWKVPEHA